MRQKIVMCVWNEYDKDDRVKKKAESLSQWYDVKVKSICKINKQEKVKKINEHLIIEYYSLSKKNKFSLSWFMNRLVLNEKFWKDKIESADIYDCNDPDTLAAGVMAKKQYGGKIVYDAHEYWARTMRKERTFYYTIYSYIGNTIQYLRELKYVKHTDRIIHVSKEIADIYKKKYKKPTYLIYNTTNYFEFKDITKNNEIVFFGSKSRRGIDGVGLQFKKHGIQPIYIGGGDTDPQVWNNKGYLSKKEYNWEIYKAKYGLCVFEVNCDNIKYSMPNKLFQYIMCECPILTIEGMVSVNKFIKKHNIGVPITDFSEESIKQGIKDLIDNYDTYLFNIQAIKRKYSWEAQEGELKKIYSFKGEDKE